MKTEDIAKRAYGIWEMAGHPQGKAVEHWLQAEDELADMLQDPPVSATTPTPAPKRPQRKKATSPAARQPRR
jgi:hypothetical protein